MKSHQPPQLIISSCWVPFLAFSAFAAMLFGIKLWLIGTYGNATPYWDQWDAEAVNLYKPFLEGTLCWTDLFAPHNEHRIFTTRLLALALLTINGIWNPLLQMVVNAALHIVALVLGITLMTRVIGRNHLPALLVFSLILFGVPYAWENTLAGFQSQFYFVLLFSIVVFVAHRNPRSTFCSLVGRRGLCGLCFSFSGIRHFCPCRCCNRWSCVLCDEAAKNQQTVACCCDSCRTVHAWRRADPVLGGPRIFKSRFVFSVS